ncbi:MAG TPA: hypothetical protein VM285_03975 [Polyangia bacterium]|nr:hypothetical protein [Polyangia bacterium]
MDTTAFSEALGLVPRPEGGFHAETCRAQKAIPAGALPPPTASADAFDFGRMCSIVAAP